MNSDSINVIACDKREAFAQGSASDAAIQSHHLLGEMDCFAALAMTDERATDIFTSVIPGRATREPGISRNDLEVPDRTATRSVRNDNKTQRRITP
jgi:hypothetical protein